MSLFAMPKWQLSCPVDGWWFILLCSIVKRAIGRYRKIHVYIYICIYIYILYFYDINRECISLFHCLHLIQCISLDTTHQRAPEKSMGPGQPQPGISNLRYILVVILNLGCLLKFPVILTTKRVSRDMKSQNVHHPASLKSMRSRDAYMRQ